jgi:hypothetical protein
LWERVAEGTLPVRGKSRRLKVQKGAFDDLVGHESGAVAEDNLLYQVPPDSRAQQAEAGRALLGKLPGRSGLAALLRDGGVRRPSSDAGDAFIDGLSRGLRCRLQGLVLELL